jgi:hypothetical protein
MRLIGDSGEKGEGGKKREKENSLSRKPERREIYSPPALSALRIFVFVSLSRVPVARR